MLECIQRNLFTDAMLSAMSIRILGSVFSKHPEINDPELFERQEFDAQPVDWTKYVIRSCHLSPAWSLEALTIDYDKIVEMVATNIAQIVSCSRIVGGTLRLQLRLQPFNGYNPHIEFDLFWIQNIKKD